MPASWPAGRRPASCYRAGADASSSPAQPRACAAASDPAFASAKFGLRALAQSAARELGPRNIHVAHLIIDAGVDTAWVRERIRESEGDTALAGLPPGRLMRPDAVADAYWQLYQQPADAWTFELEIRPAAEKW